MNRITLNDMGAQQYCGGGSVSAARSFVLTDLLRELSGKASLARTPPLPDQTHTGHPALMRKWVIQKQQELPRGKELPNVIQHWLRINLI